MRSVTAPSPSSVADSARTGIGVRITRSGFSPRSIAFIQFGLSNPCGSALSFMF